MKNLKKLSRKDLAFVSGGEVLPGKNCCGSWCLGSWVSCRMHHFECPPGADTSPPEWYDGTCPFI
ncbi:hypothetical protein F3J23_19175 [Chryseobacterium sp. Tr-659]|uniref:hypothetical protein n=1 Tax=Chryseobacterium sp. Tr-659 TaxID=2608340 RepID=UPI0014232214|nr:hypothetical protein [Chryseobacterium sp. Tr-659]NIF07549.1 hypothetical protein [Chryseobacterium sp. Tr-659]